jgi:Tfp pilus assembly protein PilV
MDLGLICRSSAIVMTENRRQAGFSLTETLLAVSTLAIGLMFIAGTFLTGMYFSTLSTERTIAAVAADEALAKVRIYGLDPNNAGLKTDGFVPYETLVTIPAEEYLYPSTREEPARQYSWAVICKRVSAGSRLVQCTVFVSRQTADATYWVRKSGTDWPQLGTTDLPRPVRVNLVQDAALANTNEVLMKDAVPTDTIDELAFIVDGSVLVDDKTGQIYRVLERYASQPDKARLDRPWTGGVLSSPAGGWVWVVPPAASGGRDPIVAVYQEVLRFSGP